MSATNDSRRQELVYDIGGILDDFPCGKISYLRAKTSVTGVFRAPTCHVAIGDVRPYLDRVLEMIKTGEMSREEALEKLVNMEMSFDYGTIYV